MSQASWSEHVFYWIYFVTFTVLRPSPPIFLFRIDMVCQSRVGQSAKKKKDKKNSWPERSKTQKKSVLSAGLSRADTVFIVCERICI